MPNKRTSEHEISKAVLRVLNVSPNGEATIGSLKKKVPNEINLTQGDLVRSETRPNEAIWEQILRNIVSHKMTAGNIIAEGLASSPSRSRLRITDAGRLHVRNMPA